MQHQRQEMIATPYVTRDVTPYVTEYAAHERRGGQIERLAAFLDQQAIDRQPIAGDVHATKRKRRRRIDTLSRLPRHRHERRS